MGYVDRLISWAGRHPYLSAAGIIITLTGVGMAVGQLYKSKDSENGASAVIAADTLQTLTQTPAPTVAAANVCLESRLSVQYVLSL